MRQATRIIIFLTVALLATTVGITIPSAPNADALTSSIWDRVLPSNQRVVGIAVSDDGSKGYFASTHNDGVNMTARIWRSTNGGSSWAVSGDIPAGSWQAVATDSTGTKVVVLGLLSGATDQSIYVSLDGGSTWTDRTPSSSPTLSSSTPSAIDIAPDGETIALATSAGVLISTDAGVNWQVTDITTNVAGVALSTDGSGLLINAFDGGGLRQVRVSGSVSVNAFQPGAINNFAVSDDGQAILLVAGGDPVTTHLSLDGGASLSSNSLIGIGVNSVAPVAVSPDGTRRAVAVYGGGLAESTGSSTAWATVEPTGFTTLTWSSLAYSENGSTLLGGPDSGARLAIRRDTPAPAVEQGIEFLIDVGGGEITVLGSYFYDITSVTAGGASATFTVVNSGEIRINVPAGAVGTVDLVITSVHGSVTVSDAIVYRPTPPPRIDNWEADAAETPGWSSVDVGLDGGIEMYLYGEYFVNVTSITVGGRPVTEYEVSSESTIYLTLPPGSPGVVDLVLTTAHGSTTLSDVIEYHGGATPTIDSLGQTSGTHRGGSVVQIYGAGLNDTTQVLFGAKSAEFEVISPRLLLAYTPSNRIGLMDISVTNTSGTTVLTDAWNSVWSPYSPEWSPIGPAQNESGVPENVTTVLPDGTGGYYLIGDFENAGELNEADLIVRWTGTAWATVGGDGSGDGRLSSTGESGVFYGSGLRTAAFDSSGRLWVGGAFELDGREVNIARIDPATGNWWAPTVVPNDIVETIEFDGATVIVGGDFGPLSGVPASSRIARLDPATDSWSAIGSDGSGGPAINGDGSIYYAGGQRTVHVIQRDTDGSILVGGSFRLSTTTRSYDMLARYDGTTWRTLLSSSGKEMVTAVVRARVNGVDSIVAGVCTLYDPTDSWAGRVVAIPATGPPITLGRFDNCVRDVEVVGDAIVVAGWFRNFEVDDVNESQVSMRSVALYRNGTWDALSDTADIDDLVLLDGDRLAAATTWERPRELSSISHLVGRTDALSVSGHSVVTDGSTLTVTVTGTGFNDRTDATIVNRPVAGLEILSSTRLRFTTNSSNAPRAIEIYGDTDSVSLTLSPPAPPPALPTIDIIKSFPTRTLISSGTVLMPGARVKVSADGFNVGEEVWIIIASTPRLLGTAIVGSNGLVTASVVLPKDLVGKHTLVVWSPLTGRGVRQAITINPAVLPATGGDGRLPTAVAFALVLVGAWLVLTSRRRSA